MAPACPNLKMVGANASTFSVELRTPFLGSADARRFCGSQYGVQLCTVAGFEWDPKKAANNVRKHGIRFADPALEDDRAIAVRDDSGGEERWVTIGMEAYGRMIVVYTWRGENIRIISARPVSKPEARQYKEHL
jgi:uncharacterized DUF497 family protein